MSVVESLDSQSVSGVQSKSEDSTSLHDDGDFVGSTSLKCGGLDRHGQTEEDTNLCPQVEGASGKPVEAASATESQPIPSTRPTRSSSLSDITLHSPSDIIGTPFDLSSTPFEYPFPETNDDSPYPLSSSVPSLTNSFSLSIPSASNSLPLLSNAVQLSLTPPHKRSFSAKYRKLRSSSTCEPPIPPGLVRKLAAGMPNRSDSDTSFGSDISTEGRTSEGNVMLCELVLEPQQPVSGEVSVQEDGEQDEDKSVPLQEE